jgi:hypothetical protein
VVGSGGAAVPLQLGGLLKEWVAAPDLEPYRHLDERQVVSAAIAKFERYTRPTAAREDYLSSYEANGSSSRCATCVRIRRSSPTLLVCYRRSKRQC